MSVQEQQMGAKEHPELLKEFGGAYNGPGVALATKVGREMAVQSGIAQTGSECTVTLLDTNIVNAFAIPGCYIYVTRGLMAIMNDEAELASVLGHEIGHVSARHAQRRQNTASLTGLGATILGLATGSGALGQIAGQAAQIWTLKYSRTQEYQADSLGIDYLSRAGYDPRAAADMLQSLEDQSELEATMRGVPVSEMPVWASTHPLTADRVERARQIAQTEKTVAGGGDRDRAAYLASIDGQLFGDAPDQGYVDGNRFAHPRLRIAFSAPQGFYLQNGAQAVTMTGPNGEQALFTQGQLRSGENLQSYVSRVASSFVQGAAARAGEFQQTTVNGLAAAYLPVMASTSQGTKTLTVAAYDASGGNAYQFVMIAPAGSDSSFQQLFKSFRRLSASEAAALKPRIIDVVTVKPGDTVSSLASRMAFDSYKVERFRTINDLGEGDTLNPGDKVKLIVYRG